MPHHIVTAISCYLHSNINTDTVPGSRSGELLYITAVDSPDRGPGLQQPPVIREEFKVNRDVY